MHFLHFTQAHNHSHVNYHMQSVLQYVHKLCVCLEGWIPFDASVVLSACGQTSFSYVHFL